MPTIEWDDSFSVGHEEIDAQHRKWIAIFNEMHKALLFGKPQDLAQAGRRAMKEMMDYAEYHFSFEEAYMKETGYPGVSDHIRLHRDFRDLVYRYNREMEDGTGLILNTDIIKIIKNWLLNHILKEDRKYADFKAGAGP